MQPHHNIIAHYRGMMPISTKLAIHRDNFLHGECGACHLSEASIHPLYYSRSAVSLDVKQVCSRAWQVPKTSLTLHAAAAKAGQLYSSQYL